MKRIEVLDVWRSLCIFIMVIYHAVYDMTLFGMADDALFDTLPLLVVRYAVAGSFILISGMVARYSRSSLRRGFFVFCVGLGVSVVSALVGLPVAFGILQLLGVAMISYGQLKERLDGTRGIAFPACCVLLFSLFLVLTEAATVSVRWLYPLGFKYEGFYSSDYYPLLPWAFVYFLGVWIGGVIDRNRERPLFIRRYPPALTFPGRHSLVIYVLHQPVLYGVCYLISKAL